jgi:hypothetical protein
MDPIVAGTLLPGVSLPSAPSGAPVDLRGGRGPQVLIVMHSPACEECRGYVRAYLASDIVRGSEWDGRLLLVVAGEVSAAADLAEAIPDAPVLADSEGKLAGGGALIVVADEWGEVYFVGNAGARHDFPGPAEIAEWVRFIAIQCPECKSPEGAWRTI